MQSPRVTLDKGHAGVGDDRDHMVRLFSTAMTVNRNHERKSKLITLSKQRFIYFLVEYEKTYQTHVRFVLVRESTYVSLYCSLSVKLLTTINHYVLQYYTFSLDTFGLFFFFLNFILVPIYYNFI